MVFGAGYLGTVDSVVPGVLTPIFGAAATVGIAWLVWPTLGLSLIGGALSAPRTTTW